MTESARYIIPASEFRCEQEIEKSRFISSVFPVTTEDEARSSVAKMKSEFPDANHNCWAYLIGPPASTDRVGYSDDGEPHGVAGKPMLTALTHGEVGDIAIIVTRYFGGIKLGKGGMVKAYTSSVKLALETMPKAEKVSWVYLQVVLNYSFVSAFERIMPTHEVEVLQKAFTDVVTFQIRLPQENRVQFCKAIVDVSSGSVQIFPVEE